jgi:Family of unknown function (DUF6516)
VIAEGWDYLLDLHRQTIRYDNDYWVTVRVTKVRPSAGRPHGLKYSLTLHDQNDDRILGYDNSHQIDVATGPARRAKRSQRFDHIDRRGKLSVPYEFTTPYQLVADLFSEVDEILKKEGVQ